MSCSKTFCWLLLATLGCSGESDCRKTLTCGEQSPVSTNESLDGGFDGGSQSSGNSGSSNGGNQAGNSGNGGSDGLDGGAGGSEGTAGSPGGGSGGTGLDSDGGVGVDGGAPQDSVFVDASAPDGGDGTIANPLNSIVAALSRAKAVGAADIYICTGNYDESVVITNNEAGIDLHGGFDCNFAYDASQPVVSPSSGEYALRIDGLTSAILIEDLAFTAVDAIKAGESSIAAFITESTNVTFDHCQFNAGNGARGDDGVTEPFVEGAIEGVNWPVKATLHGNDGTAAAGGATRGPVLCPAGDSSYGGKGGEPLPPTDEGADGTAGGPDGRGGPGDPNLGPSCSSYSWAGLAGPDGADGIAVPGPGTLSVDGFAPSDGDDGELGEVGGGGGGGHGTDANGGNGGGSGGAGGCGGNFGPGGQGGGASIALLTYASTIALLDSELTSGNAGGGGNGAIGQLGQELNGYPGSASLGGAGPDIACGGGPGGAGGKGGDGGGGAAGISVGILWSGPTAPTLDQPTTDAISFGTKGSRGSGGGIAADGVAGFAEAIHQL